MPKISVIMGVYNCKNFNLLNKSICSIIQQTFSDWEFIICDDGSTNGTLDELHKFSELDNRIRIISYSDNKGLSYALNCCLKQAQGDYIARQDDDDISEPNRFEKEILFLDNNPEYGFVGTIAKVFDENGEWGEFIIPEQPTKKSFLWSSPFLHPSIMVRKTIFDECHGYSTDIRNNRAEDYDLFMRIYALGYKGYNIQEKLYQYKISNDRRKKYRSMKDRYNEAVTRYRGYKLLGIPWIKSFPFVIKPIIVGLIPQGVFYKIRKNNYSN